MPPLSTVHNIEEDDISARHGAARVRQHNAGPPGGSPRIHRGHPFLVVPHLLPAFFTSTAKGRHSRCGDGYCKLKLDLRLPYGFVSVKFLPSYGTFCFSHSAFTLYRGLLVLASFYAPPTAGAPALRYAERGHRRPYGAAGVSAAQAASINEKTALAVFSF
jgi:hypothetical protein